MPESIQGAEMLTNTDIGKSANYQNIASFTFGTFATALTLFFYELNIKDLPKHFLRTTLSIYEKIKEGNVSDAIKLFGLTLLAFGASYFSGIGFRFVAESAVSDGSLSYLGNWVSGLIPDGLFTAVIAMLWSHLQDLINQSNQELPIIDVERLEQINARNACMLLSQPNTDISPLNGNRYTLFYFDKDYEVQIGNQQKKQSNAQEKNYV